jgi:hypothetical protein
MVLSVIDARADEILAPLREAYEGRAIPAVFVPGAVSRERADALREAVLEAPRQRFDVANRGRYETTRDVRDLELESQLRELAEYFARADLEVGSLVWTVMRHGDYALRHGDERVPRDGSRVVELTLDVSRHASNEADLIYAKDDGPIVFAAPQEPGGLAIVERSQGVRRYERYLTHRVGDLAVVRLRLRFRVQRAR